MLIAAFAAGSGLMADTASGGHSAAVRKAGALPLASPPGYELRVLDARKPVRFRIDGNWVEGELPVFIYYPIAEPERALVSLREADAELDLMARKPEWTAEEVRRLIAHLQSAIASLEKR
jgi:hypothetical protein